MTKEQLKIILKRLDFWIKKDKEIQKAIDEFMKVVAPGSYSPIFEPSYAIVFIEAVCNGDEKLKEHLLYYAYELWSMEKAEGKIKDKTYNLKVKSQYIDFILDSE